MLFTLEELDEFTFVDETDQQAVPDVTRIGPSQEKWGWIMFECGLENLTIKGKHFVVEFCLWGKIEKLCFSNLSYNAENVPAGVVSQDLGVPL